MSIKDLISYRNRPILKVLKPIFKLCTLECILRNLGYSNNILSQFPLKSNMGQKFARGKSSFTEIFVFESLSWHSCDMDLKVLYVCHRACIVWSVQCKKYVNNDINFHFQSFDVIFEDSGNKFTL